MKNKLFKLFVYIFFNLLICQNVFSEEIVFNTKEILIKENGKIIEANDGEASSEINNFTINARKFFYDKEKLILKANDSLSEFKNDNIKVKSQDLKYSKNKFLIEIKENVEITDLNHEIKIFSDEIFYDLKKKIIYSNKKTQIRDNNDNKYYVESFNFKINEKKIKLFKLEFVDIDKNKINSKIAYLDLLNEKLDGKDLEIDLKNFRINPDNQPRLKGRSYSYKDDKSTINKGSFTLCKIRNEKCPPWEMNAEKITHNKIDKTIYYDNAWLQLYDKPILYFPKFFHPDPSVDRRSGFLMPGFEDSSNTGASLHIPYYKVFSDSSDMTFTPRIYDHQKALLQTEYRQVKKNSALNLDASILRNNNESSKNHIFINKKNNLNLFAFSESELNFRLERTSNDTYLKSYKLKSPIIKDKDVLRNTINFRGENIDSYLQTDFHIFEDLNKNKSDRYEFVYPSYELEKRFDSIDTYDGNFLLKSVGFQKKYNTNVDEQVNINDFRFSAIPKINTLGFRTSSNLLLKNTNTNSQNSNKYKSDNDHKVMSIGEINSSLPLVKKGQNYQQTFSPKISLRYSPNVTKNIKKSDNRINANNIFDFNRLSDNETVEGGGSLTYGFDYSTSNENRTFFNSKIANIIRNSENEDLPDNSKLGNKTSDIVGSIMFSPNDIVKFDYDFSQDNNFKDNNYQLLKSEFKINNFVTSFEYLNEQNTSNKEHYLSHKASYIFDDSNLLSYTTRRNKKTKLTEFYNLIYEYKNDCLKASLEYNKEYYNTADIKPEENIFFRLTIMPFGETKGPNLK